MRHDPGKLEDNSHHNHNAHFGALHEEPFDSSFPFLDPVGGMQYFASTTSTPAPSAMDDSNMPRLLPEAPIHENMREAKANEHQSDVNMETGHQPDSEAQHIPPNPMSSPSHHLEGLSIHMSGDTDRNAQFAFTLFGGDHHHSPYNQVPHRGFHPYRPYTSTGVRPDRHAIYTQYHPLSPPLSLSTSPTGSASERHLQLLGMSPTAVSPSLVSPASIESPLYDLSPNRMAWSEPLPQHPPGHNYMPFGPATPMTSMGHMPSTVPGMVMMGDLPFSSAQSLQGPTTRGMVRSVRPRMIRKSTSKSQVEAEQAGEDEAEEAESDGSETGLGLRPEGDTAGSTGVRGKREDYRKHRIQSEQTYTYKPRDRTNLSLSKKSRAEECQRRRDILREGFRRLAEALPASNQRPSKSSLLDRAVAHIEQMDSENRYLADQLDAMTKETDETRAAYQELAHAIAMNGRSSNPRSSRDDKSSM